MHVRTSLLVIATFVASASAQENTSFVARTKLVFANQKLLANKGDVLRVIRRQGNQVVVQSPTGLTGTVAGESIVPLKDSAAVYSELIQAKPQEANLYMMRANVWAMRGENDKAISDCSEAIKLGSKEPSVFVNRGVFYASAGNLDKALADYDRALALDPKNEPAHINRAAAFLAKKEFAAAIATYSTLVEQHPKSVRFLIQRGVAYRHQQAWDKAVDDFSAAIKLDPKNVAAISSRGFVYYMKGAHDRAVADFDTVLKLQPNNAMALNNRGYNKQKIQDYSGALADFDAALRLAPDYAMALQNRAWLLATCPDDKIRNPTEAFASANKACVIRKFQVASDLKALAAAYAENGDFDRAVEYQTKVVALTKTDKAIEQRLLAAYRTRKPARVVLAENRD